MLGLNTAEVTGTNPGRCTVKKVGGRMSDILWNCFKIYFVSYHIVSKHRCFINTQLFKV